MGYKPQKIQTAKDLDSCDGLQDKCNVLKNEEMDGMRFDYCQTCFKIFNGKKIAPIFKEKVKADKKPKKDASVRMGRDKVKKIKPQEHVFNHHWYLSDGYPAPGIEQHDTTVFSCFACGGGSTMGYKLAGYKVLGCNEIDKEIIECYIANHNPEIAIHQSIQDFVAMIKADIPAFKKKYPKLFNLGVLDGSPPCSSFSMNGLREKAWGQEKNFREGQVSQVLDTLFFDFIELAKILQPKVVVAENVTGILMGEAIEYCRRIYADFDEAGYLLHHWTLDASDMGVPQKRKRVFFIAIRKDLTDLFDGAGMQLFSAYPPLNLNFKEPNISFKKATQEFWEDERKPLGETAIKWYFKTEEGKTFSEKHTNGSLFNWHKIAQNKPVPTLVANNTDSYFHPVKEGSLNEREFLACGSYPLDYNSLGVDVRYMVGMSVPPLMMAQIANRIKKQWLDVINGK